MRDDNSFWLGLVWRPRAPFLAGGILVLSTLTSLPKSIIFHRWAPNGSQAEFAPEKDGAKLALTKRPEAYPGAVLRGSIFRQDGSARLGDTRARRSTWPDV